MKKNRLVVFVFNQHWFHLAALIEAILEHESKYELIEINFIKYKSLRIKPEVLHFYFPLSENCPNNPFAVVSKYLTNKLGNKIKINLSWDVKSTPLNNNLEVDSLKNLQYIKYQDSALGMAVGSYLISMSKSADPDLVKYKNLIEKSCSTYISIFEDVLQKSKIWKKERTEIWVCNGRMLHERAVAEAAKRIDLKIRFYEIAGDGFKLQNWIVHDYSPHNRVEFQNEIKDLYAINGMKNVETNKLWFKKNSDPKFNEFIRMQTRGLNYQKINKPYVVFFTSSDDEIASISEEWFSPWGSQFEATKNLISNFNRNREISLIIRVHPNQRNKSKKDIEKWNSLRNSDNVTIISMSSKIDSYALLSDSVGVISYGSTMGVEAAFRDIPVGLLSPTRYDMLIKNTKLFSHQDLDKWRQMLLEGNSKLKANSKQKLGPLMWANYFQFAGQPWKNIEVAVKNNRKVGLIDGVSLRPRNSYIVLTRICLYFIKLYEKYKV